MRTDPDMGLRTTSELITVTCSATHLSLLITRVGCRLGEELHGMSISCKSPAQSLERSLSACHWERSLKHLSPRDPGDLQRRPPQPTRTEGAAQIYIQSARMASDGRRDLMWAAQRRRVWLAIAWRTQTLSRTAGKLYCGRHEC